MTTNTKAARKSAPTPGGEGINKKFKTGGKKMIYCGGCSKSAEELKDAIHCEFEDCTSRNVICKDCFAKSKEKNEYICSNCDAWYCDECRSDFMNQCEYVIGMHEFCMCL